MNGEPGSIVAVFGEDTNAVKAGLGGVDGLGSGFDMHTVREQNLIVEFDVRYFLRNIAGP